MEIKLNIEKKHFWILMAVFTLIAAGIGTMIVMAQGMTLPAVYHTLDQLITKDATGNQIYADSDNNGIIDKADNATVANRTIGMHVKDDGVGESYDVSLERYHMTLTATNYASKSKQIPDDILMDLCGDFDGCEYRIGMTKWSVDSQTQTASRVGLFYIDPVTRHWRNSYDVEGIDNGDDTPAQHIHNLYDTCFFTDGEYPSGNDKQAGINLLVWTGYTNVGRTCELTLID